MIIEINNNLKDPVYIQVRNQIIFGIANGRFKKGDVILQAYELADYIGINLHSVSKAYSLLRKDGFIRVNRRNETIIAMGPDDLDFMQELQNNMVMVLTKTKYKNISREEVHNLIDSVYDKYEELR